MEKLAATTTPTSGCSASRVRKRVQALVGEAGGADHGMDAVVDAPRQVVHHRIRMGEVDDHLGGLDRSPVIAGIHRGDQVQPVGRLDRPADLGAHPAPGTENRDIHGVNLSGTEN